MGTFHSKNFFSTISEYNSQNTSTPHSMRFFETYPKNDNQYTSMYYTPKILTDVNTQSILQGHEYDSYFANCFLENHLHRFGGLVDPERTVNSFDDEQQSDCSYEEINDIMLLQPDLQSLSNGLLNNSSFYPEEDCAPPPYSELPDDPPPSYTESLFLPQEAPHEEMLRDHTVQFSHLISSMEDIW